MWRQRRPRLATRRRRSAGRRRSSTASSSCTSWRHYCSSSERLNRWMRRRIRVRTPPLLAAGPNCTRRPPPPVSGRPPVASCLLHRVGSASMLASPRLVGSSSMQWSRQQSGGRRFSSLRRHTRRWCLDCKSSLRRQQKRKRSCRHSTAVGQWWGWAVGVSSGGCEGTRVRAVMSKRG